ncbi:MAG: hypothetical protein ACREIV_07200, partial [Planctomycetaceae bacterium]
MIMDQVYTSLSGVRRRQRWALALRMAICGGMLSAAAGILLGVWRLWSTEPVAPWITGLVLLAGPLLGLIAGLVWRRTWHDAAVAVDGRYRLKDRTLTALEFLHRSEVSAFHQLQIDDATRHLSGVEPAKVVPLRLPRELPYAVGGTIVALALLLWPQTRIAHAAPVQVPGIVAVAEELTEDLQQLEQTAEEEQNEELKELVEELREQVEEMQQPGVDVREALATLSEMQQAIQKQQAQYNEGLVDAQLQSLGGAMMSSDALNAAAAELQEGDLEKAAEELQKLEKVELERREAKAVEERMKKVAQAMQESGLGALSESATEMADGIGSGNSSKTSRGAQRLSRQVRQHNARRKINRLLLSQLRKLSECKSLCQSCLGNCPFCNSQCQGQCLANSLKQGLNPNKSTKPSQNFGMTTSGNVFGDETKLASQRNLQEITGTPGDGPSEVETTNSPEGRERASRQYREVFKD